jgi:hypothetical protein
LFTVIIWSLQIATDFPPGALTVISRPHEKSASTKVMALNTTFMGIGDRAELQDTSIALLAYTGSAIVM